MVSCKSIRHSGIRKHRRAPREELHEDGECKHYCSTSFSSSIKEYLCSRKTGRGCQNRIEVVYAKAQGDSQHPTKNTGHEDRCLDGNRSSNGSIMGLLGHAILINRC